MIHTVLQPHSSSLCYERDVCPSVCNIGRLWSLNATKSGNRHVRI